MGAQGWYLDPFRLHDDRWFSGGRPTNLVRDAGVESYEDPPEGLPPGPLVPAGTAARTGTVPAGTVSAGTVSAGPLIPASPLAAVVSAGTVPAGAVVSAGVVPAGTVPVGTAPPVAPPVRPDLPARDWPAWTVVPPCMVVGILAGLGIVVNFLGYALNAISSEGVQGYVPPNGWWVLAGMAGGVGAFVASLLVAARCRPRWVAALVAWCIVVPELGWFVLAGYMAFHYGRY